MNYQHIYNNLCQRGTYDREIGYIEKHHIVPRCMGGGDEQENIAYLSAREHYVAHKLLTKIHPHSPSLWYAFRMMFVSSRNHTDRIFKSRDYSKIQEAISKNGGCMSPDARKRISRRMRDHNPSHTHPDSLKRGSIKRLDRYRRGEFKIEKTAEDRKRLSQRMRDHNPSHTHPDSIHNLAKIKIEFESGESFIYKSIAEAHRSTGIPYSSIRNLKRIGHSSKKYAITSVIEIVD